MNQNPRSYLSLFLPGRDHRWLISLTLTTAGGRRTFTLQCWDLTNSPNCIARRTLSDFRGFRINTDPFHAAALALRSSNGLEILEIEFSASDPDSGFVTLQALVDVHESLHVFSGSTLLTKFGDRDTQLHIRCLENPDVPVELRNPSHNEPKECVDAIVTDKYAVVVRTATLEFYSLSSIRAGSGAHVIEPIASHTWQWRVDSVSMAYQPSWEAAARATEPPINILVRYASLFPWPVNALHHYVLPCDDSYDPQDPIDGCNRPYCTEAILIRTFASPIRLFARWDMVLRFLRDGVVGRFPYGGLLRSRGWRGRDLLGLFSQPSSLAWKSSPLNDQGISAVASMVYQVREDDRWVRIAIQEQEGKIAVGTSTAEITIFQYI
ncbi:F-box domain-containing protein [Mycena venus]|uniref:F-box domain-containing protein n=1 Tax=Mycena venus TaxID=2733690 RepID=A0A8H6YC65_9AGAR|nr:F-box domain-containing protein [Mycena venus]